MSVLSVLTIHV